MALNLTRTFSNAVTALGSWLDDNFTAIQNFINNNLDATVVKDSAKVGGFTPAALPSAGQIPVIDTLGELVLPGSLSHATSQIITANAKLDGATWKFRGTGYAMRVDINIATHAAPKFYQSTASGIANGVITWTAALDFVLGSASAAPNANTLLEIVSGLYRQASDAPSANNIVVLSTSGHLDLKASSGGDILLANGKAIKIDDTGAPVRCLSISGGDVVQVGDSTNDLDLLGSVVKINGVSTGGFMRCNDAETLTIRGEIQATTATILKGTGFTASRPAPGQYRISLVPTFTGNITGMACIIGSTGFIYVTSAGTSMDIFMKQADGVTVLDSDFSFSITGEL